MVNQYTTTRNKEPHFVEGSTLIGPRRMGRPVDSGLTYDKKAVQEHVLEQMELGRSPTAICRDDPGMPQAYEIHRWAWQDEDFARDYARARDQYLDRLADQCIEIADDSRSDRRKDGSYDHEHINRSRLRFDARRWYLSKLAPKRYGDRLELNHNGGLANLGAEITPAQLAARLHLILSEAATDITPTLLALTATEVPST